MVTVQPVDFRSDTVTRPDAAMREAIARAEVGDDVFGDDPTVRRLEEIVARGLGKEAAVFCPSGTQANQIAIRVHTRPGDEVLLHEGAHVYRFEQGGLAALHGVQAVPLRGEGGRMSLEDLEGAVRGDDPHLPRTRLVVLENTHNLSGGRVLPAEHVEAVSAFARSRGLALHLDGARLANAAVASGRSLAALAAPADSVSLCLSKGLGAPVGSLLAGAHDFVARARRARKLLGGGMRQAGLLAAAGLLAFERGPERLAADHERARRLAEGLAALPGLEVVPPETNIVVARVLDRAPVEFVRALAARGTLVVPFGPGGVRFTLHHQLGDDAVARALDDARRVLEHSSPENPDS